MTLNLIGDKPAPPACIEFDRSTDEWVLRIRRGETRFKRSERALFAAAGSGFVPASGSVAIGTITLKPAVK